MEAGRREFLSESIDSMVRMKEQLLRSQGVEEDDGSLMDLHHALRTVRGACSFFGIANVATLAQKGAVLVAALRERKIPRDTTSHDTLLRLVEVIACELEGLRNEVDTPLRAHDELLGRLQGLIEEALPATAEPLDSVQPRQQTAGTGGARRALVVDDSRAMRRLLARMLGGLGLEVIEAESGEKGLEVLASMTEAPDIVLIDWTLPHMDGVQFVRCVRALPRMTEVPVMMVTSETTPHQAEKALAAGVTRYVTKPFTRERIVEVVQDMGVIG